jgi:hypothetical protein
MSASLLLSWNRLNFLGIDPAQLNSYVIKLICQQFILTWSTRGVVWHFNLIFRIIETFIAVMEVMEVMEVIISNSYYFVSYQAGGWHFPFPACRHNLIPTGIFWRRWFFWSIYRTKIKFDKIPYCLLFSAYSLDLRTYKERSTKVSVRPLFSTFGRIILTLIPFFDLPSSLRCVL